MPLLWLSLAFLMGITFAYVVGGVWYFWLLPAISCIPLTILELAIARRQPQLQHLHRMMRLPLLLILVAFFAGGCRYQLTQQPFTETDLAWYNNRGTILIVGEVVSPPDVRENATLLRIGANSITLLDGASVQETKRVNGFLLARLPPASSWQYGDVLEINGVLESPPVGGEFSYRDYLARQNVHSYIFYPHVRLITTGAGNPVLAAIYALRQRSYEFINQCYPMPESSLLSGILLGIETDLPQPLQDAFITTGTSHIIAISGFNIAILAALITKLFSRIFHRRLVYFSVTILAIGAYTVLVGAQPPVVRAAIMGSMGLMGNLVGRRQTGMNSLGFVAALMCLFNPLLLWDPGFQLSFAATMGLVLFADPLQSFFIRGAIKIIPDSIVNRISAPIGEYILVTLAAQLTTLPVIIAQFHRLSVSLFLANLFILPAQPLVMILGGISVICGLLIPFLGQALAYLAWTPLAYTIHIVELMSKSLPGAIYISPINIILIVFYYVVLISFPLIWRRFSALRQYLSFSLAVVSISLLAILIWRAALTSPDGYLRLIVLNVPHGPALLIQSPTGDNVLINASSSSSLLASELESRISPFNHHLDLLLLTAAAEQTYQSFPPIMQRFPILNALWNDKFASNTTSRSSLASLQLAGTNVQKMGQGQVISLGSGGAELQILVENTSGSALLLQWHNFRALIPGGVPLEELAKQHESISGLSLLLLTTPDLNSGQIPQDWEHLQPDVILWSGYQSPAISDASWFSITPHGWISATTDGFNLWFEAGN